MKKNTNTNKKSSPHESLYEVISSIESSQLVQDFLSDLLTPVELQAVSDRWNAAKLLNNGMTQRQVANQLGLSVTTVTRVAKSLANKEGGYNTILANH